MRWTPHDLPHLAAKTVDTLTTSQEKFDALIHQPDANPDTIQKISTAISATIRIMKAPLTWMDEGICHMIADTYDTVPEWTPGEILPAPHGLTAFATPPTLTTHEGKDVRIDAVGWLTIDNAVWIEVYSRDAESHGSISSGPIAEVFHILAPLDTPTGRGINAPIKTLGGDLSVEQAHKAMAVAGTLWLLMSQPQIVEESTPITARVRNKTGGRVTPRREVKVSTRTLTKQMSTGTAAGRGKPATSRWWVRGHWRQQAYGEGRKLRRPVFIHPHTAGATEGELDPRPQVQVRRAH